MTVPAGQNASEPDFRLIKVYNMIQIQSTAIAGMLMLSNCTMECQVDVSGRRSEIQSCDSCCC